MSTAKRLLPTRCLYNNADIAVLSSTAGIRGLTRFILVVVRGFPVDGGPQSTTVSTSAGKVDMVWSNKYEFTSISDSESVTNFNNTLTSLGTQDLVNIGSGAVTTFTAA